MNDGGLAVVRMKPLGAGGGGGERSSASGAPSGVTFSAPKAEVTVDGRLFSYPSHVIAPEMDQQALYDAFMPVNMQAFVDGVNVNVIAYGQTGSGKTHTVFGPPGILARAAAGELGDGVDQDYGLFPRGVLGAVDTVGKLRQEGIAAVLTASAVELSIMGNEDMLARSETAVRRAANDGAGTSQWSSAALGVALDKASDPPRLCGMTELPLDSPADVRLLCGALATRNTAGTLMNNTSSRSHCFAFLTLRVLKDEAGVARVRTSRFQFVDLAGSERLKDAHGASVSWKEGGEALNGMLTNYSLTMLSACVRGLVEAKRKRAKFSFRAFLSDLVDLLQESMTGDAATACFVCLSQAPTNLVHSKFALDFGEVFAQLSAPRPRATKPVPLALLAKQTNATLGEARRALQGSKSGGRLGSRLSRDGG
ncbi:hypothetical protein EMIHUDRAFT_117465 [Emiliania huxleyi CCMP1516]|uniref:Kinesin-like protein n=2 Tax=Emiliania huxleyi TaxID=2903 RepID=A0A0D3JBA8_EMIH1|nr:hypothetical protein EMIHUDRAFT_117465 [Emiliania huxleyi CCMP1516]EOD20793.1 hypothetical protein EMIHUDRAFT_117465 [Emiliania huxleyi CCMP1516]|eukprot:XP_005773222.1 hypothetical protein EMIHUDRAFT_117465 [Emiliania huxleyi CCMP1516]